MWPQGSITIEWPQQAFLALGMGADLADREELGLRLEARARASTSQWSLPVISVKAAGSTITSAPASRSLRNSSGKRMS